jgi:hypothetical protein
MLSAEPDTLHSARNDHRPLRIVGIRREEALTWAAGTDAAEALTYTAVLLIMQR